MRHQYVIALLAALSISTAVNAAVSQAEANRLGVDLTPMGGIKAGNKDGSIPAWDGGLNKPPAGSGYKLGDHHPDPYPSEKPLFVIDSTNFNNYKSFLSVGQIAMFQKYKGFKMPVFTTHRSAAFSQRIYDMTKKNAVTGKMVADGDGVSDVAEGIPFPITKNGAEMIWNHKLKFKGVSARRYADRVAPTADGKFTPIKVREELLGLYYKPGNTIKDTNNILIYFYQVVESPARLAGSVLLVHETLNQVTQPRQAWVYNAGQRRVRKAPNVAYDNPGTASEGLYTNDMTDMFNGALDRYDWKFVGDREMYVNYNAYRVHKKGLTFEQLVRPGFINPEYQRYEKHRVHVVEATLKPGLRHINKRRTFYLDEDSYQILLADHYDNAGAIWRFSEAAALEYYEMPLMWTTLETHHDLKSGRYISVGLDNLEPMYDFSFQTTPANFSPQALRTRGTR
jgi:Protein of unknown function (DUF1329)